MTVNNDFCKKFWTPDYTKDFSSTLSNYPFEGSSRLFDGIIDTFSCRRRAIEERSQKKGALMLALCVAALALIGFEDGMDCHGVAIGFYMASALSLIALLVPRFFLKKWKRVVFSLLGIGVVTVLGYLYTEQLIPHAESLRWVYDLRKIALVVVFLLPIVHQLGINWLHSSVYMGYLNAEIDREYQKYEAAKRHWADGVDTNVDEEYVKAIGASKFKRDNLDAENVLTGVLKHRLEKAAMPGSMALMLSWLKYKKNKLGERLKLIERPSDAVVFSVHREKTAVSQVAPVAVSVPRLDFTQEYERYMKAKKADKKLSLKRFCTNENISFNDMRAWCRVYKK